LGERKFNERKRLGSREGGGDGETQPMTSGWGVKSGGNGFNTGMPGRVKLTHRKVGIRQKSGKKKEEKKNSHGPGAGKRGNDLCNAWNDA